MKIEIIIHEQEQLKGMVDVVCKDKEKEFNFVKDTIMGHGLQSPFEDGTIENKRLKEYCSKIATISKSIEFLFKK